MFRASRANMIQQRMAARRNFSSELTNVVASQTIAEPTVAQVKEQKAASGKVVKQHFKSLKDISNIITEEQAAIDAKNQEYYDMLNDVEARQKYFSALTSHKDGDHSEIKQVKAKIA